MDHGQVSTWLLWVRGPHFCPDVAETLFSSQSLPSGLLECPQDMAACLAPSKTKNEGENGVAVFLDSSSAVTLPIQLRVHWCNNPDSFGKCQEQNLMYALIATMQLTQSKSF